jgi:hypothetical protein
VKQGAGGFLQKRRRRGAHHKGHKENIGAQESEYNEKAPEDDISLIINTTSRTIQSETAEMQRITE